MQIHDADRTVALLADDDLGFALERVAVLVHRPVVELLAVEEHDQVGVLLDGARLAQVGELRALVVARALLRRARELRQRDDRNAQLLRERLEPARDLTDTSCCRLSEFAGPCMSCR